MRLMMRGNLLSLCRVGERAALPVFLILAGTFLSLALVFGGCSREDAPGDTRPEDPEEIPTAAPIEPPVEVSAQSYFAPYRLEPVTITPSIDQPEIAPGLGNVHIPMVLSDTQRARLARDGFVVSPGRQEKEFFILYEKARYENIPIFVTSDSLLHAYHLMFGKTLRTAETQYFYPLLQELNRALIADLDHRYHELSGSPWEETALRAVAFVSVAGSLADPDFEVPAYASALVDAELALIEEAEGINPSPLFPQCLFGEDYTQYIARGHYTKSEALTAYFKSMIWYGRRSFRLEIEDETRVALLLVQSLRDTSIDGHPVLEIWADLYNPTAFLVGRSDDLTAFDYLPLMDKFYGPRPASGVLTADDRLEAFIAAARELEPPRILGMAVFEAEEIEDTAGLRFMGQRFVPDAFIFQQLTSPKVGTLEERRGLPSGLDLFAAMGSDRAYALLEEKGETGYEGYREQVERMRDWTGALSVDEWTETVNNAWLYSFYPLLEEPGEGYPLFMQTEAWLDKQLHTSLGSWAELKHDTILYAKQSYSEMGGDWLPTPPDPLPARGYVEPVPEFYARLAALAAMTREGLGARGLLNEEDDWNLEIIENLSLDLKTMSEKQLQGVPLSEAEYETIRFYGGTLELLVMAAADSEDDDSYGGNYMDEDPQAAVIADVATDPMPSGYDFDGSAVLEVGVGRINDIHVVVPLVEDDGSLRLQVAKGGVFSFYEFPWPAADRLTDEKWQAMLEEGSAPPPPAWTESFITAESEFHELQKAIYAFQLAWVDAAFYLDERYLQGDRGLLAQGQALELIHGEIEAMRAAKEFEGRRWLDCAYRSFDRQSSAVVVVTVRETWQDILYRYENPEHPIVAEDESDMIESAQRGPYTLDITYTLEDDPEQGWVVTRIVQASPRPAW